ncbi:MAG: stage II sporulation protein P [Lachnospiraceae bacterium]|nr:stage II sporulation protein P [Lachnospiraceae bacterium]
MIKKNKLPVLIGSLATLLLVCMVNHFEEKSLQTILPVLAYQEQKGLIGSWTELKLEELLPVFSYPEENKVVARREDVFLLRKIKPVELLTMMEFENAGNSTVPEKAAEAPTEVPQATELPQNTQEPPESTAVMASGFVPHTLQNIVDLKALSDYETLVKNFYIIDSVAMIGSDMLDAESLAGVDLRISKQSEGPQILIYHTHSQEGFADSVPGDDSTTIMGVGEHLAEILRNQYGYEVLHHMGKYDVETRDNAYSRALPEIQQILEENPSIQVVVDLHRDAVADESNKLVMDLDGRPTARFMFFNGVSCTRKTGNIDYLYNPNLADNLAFSFQLKKVAEEYYPGLTRKNYIHGYRYNMHLCGRTTLLELGAQNNTLEEAMNACDPIAHILDMVLTGA